MLCTFAKLAIYFFMDSQLMRKKIFKRLLRQRFLIIPCRHCCHALCRPVRHLYLDRRPFVFAAVKEIRRSESGVRILELDSGIALECTLVVNVELNVPWPLVGVSPLLSFSC